MNTDKRLVTNHFKDESLTKLKKLNEDLVKKKKRK